MNPNTTQPHQPGEFGEPPPPTVPVRTAGYYIRRVLKPIASLQLTVGLFVLGMLLIWFGTMAQIDHGIWTVVDKYFASFVVWVPFELFHKFLTVFWKEQFPAGESAWTGAFPFPAGYAIGGAMFFNLIAAHALRFRLSWKRIGVLMIHSGLLMLFVGEFVTRQYAIEQRMTIDEGSSVGYTEDTRNYEVAFVDKSDPNSDTQVTIPHRMLKNATGRITHPDLPVDVEVVDYMVNSRMVSAHTVPSNPADKGIGLGGVAVKQPEVSGVDPKQTIDLPSAYVRLYKKGTDQALGTYLVSLSGNLQFGPDEVDVDGKKLELSMRLKRYYKPYRIHLDKFSFDRYTGTEKAKNFSSDVRVYDAAGNLVRQQRIAMNEPMRYAGETFYQQSFDERTEKTTVLQVVKNPGWLNFGFFHAPIDYIGCAVVGTGLLVHFLTYLILFLRRLKTGERVVLTGFAKSFPWVVVGVMALYLVGVSYRMTPKKEPVDLDAVGRLVVHEGGRAKPLDTAARIHLRLISGKEETEDEDGNKVSAIQWYLDVLAGGGPQDRGRVWKYKFIRIDNEQVLEGLGLKPREGLRYSLEEIEKNLSRLEDRMIPIARKLNKKEKLDQTESKYKEVYDRRNAVFELAAFGGPLLLPPHEGVNKDWASMQQFRGLAMHESVQSGMATTRAKIAPKLDNFSPADEVKVFELLGLKPERLTADQRAKTRQEVLELLRAQPDRIPDSEMRRLWLDTAFALLTQEEQNAIRAQMRADFQKRLAAHPSAVVWEKIADAYRDNRPNDFSAAVAEYRAQSTPHVSDVNATPRALEWVLYTPFNWIGLNKVEVSFNRFAPFYQCSGLYVLVFFLTVVGFTQQAAGRPQWSTALRRSAFLLLLLTLTIHTVALFARMYIMDRPMVFVTNLYSSAIFIGWGCVVLGIALELIFKMGIGNILASILGLATCIVAHNLATDDTLEMMQAVLDTNFWLSTHVTTVTFGYTATFVAGALGAIYVLQMLGAVIRDSYESKGEPTVGSLLAFGVAATGVVGIPLFLLWFAKSALAKFEVFPSFVLDAMYWLAFGAAVIYALALMLLRVAYEGVDGQGRPREGRVPGLAKPVVALALTPERGKVFGQMVYGVVCFATMLSFIGTVLGGIWADQSWGRFWGWDPKENGAVLIVLWNALILHARWCGLVKDRGVAVLAIFGNVMTAWSWFGTNQLSIGLHAYGFDSRLADGCFNFWISQMFILGWGLIPRQFWASANRRAAPVAPPAAAAAAAAAPVAPPSPTGTAAPNGSANSQPQSQPNGTPNGHPNGHPRRDKGKKPGKRR